MIKFFRKIRLRLVTANKIHKYILYAVGEIILVVIGILIALQINNANETKKERRQEINYLTNVKFDLQMELQNNQNFIENRFGKAQACSRLLNSEAPATTRDVEIYTETYEQVFIWYEYVPNNNTYKELLSSGNLSLITNDTIKNGMLELEKSYAAISLGELHMRREFEAYLYDPHIHNARALGYFDLTKPTKGLPRRLSFEEIPENVHRQLLKDAKWQHQDPVFKNGLRLALMNNSFLAGLHQNLDQRIMALIEMIDREVGA